MVPNNGVFSHWQNKIADLPQDVHKHCLVTLGNGDLFHTGGFSSSFSSRIPLRTSWRYIKQENRWKQKTDMITGRYKHGCGRVTNPTTGKEEVVVVGGKSGAYSSSSEIYTVEDDTWRQGIPLPRVFGNLASLPYGDSFLILGGYGKGPCSDSIYQVYLFIIIC